MLIGSFLNKFKKENQKSKTISEATLEALKKYTWPGNVRELQNRIQRACILSPENEIKLNDVFSKDEIDQMRLSPASESNQNNSNSDTAIITEADVLNDTSIESIVQPSGEENSDKSIPENFDLEKQLENYEKILIEKALQQTGGNLTNAAKLLNLSFRSIRYKVKKYNIKH